MQGYQPKDNQIFTVTNVPCNRSRCILKFIQSKRSRKHTPLIPRLDYNIHEKSDTKTHRKRELLGAGAERGQELDRNITDWNFNQK